MSPIKPLTDSEKLDLLIRNVQILAGVVAENHEEVVEKLNNLNLNGTDYSVEDADYEDE